MMIVESDAHDMLDIGFFCVKRINILNIRNNETEKILLARK